MVEVMEMIWTILKGALFGWLFYGPEFRKYCNRDEEFFLALLHMTWTARRVGIGFEELAIALANTGRALEKLFMERR